MSVPEGFFMRVEDVHLSRLARGIRRLAPLTPVLFFLLLGVFTTMTTPAAHGEDPPAGPRSAAWKAVETALAEGKPKTAVEALRGVEQAAVADKAWAEVARAIATRILGETGDRPGDDPERLILLAGAMEKAPPETRGVLEAIRANWTWGFFLENRWRYQQRTQGGADGTDLAKLAEWDLPTIVAEIRRRFATAVGGPGSPERAALQKLPVAEWSAIIQPGKLADAYRPTVWDVVVRDAVEFASSGERGLVAPEDAFEFDAASPALGTPEQFLAWQPEADKAVTDRDSPLLETARLYRDLLAFHRGDADRTAFLAADLDRILWASGAAVSHGDAADLHDRKQEALEGFIERAGGHETAALARFHLASLVQQGDGGGAGDGDPAEARVIALQGAESHPKSPGGAMCRNLVSQIEAKELSLQTERAWAEPWPAVRITYRNLAKLHLRVAKADWLGRLKAGKPHTAWMDGADRQAILELPAVRTKEIDLPATADYRQRYEDIPVGEPLDAKSLEPGTYWVIASHKPDFGVADNVVQIALVRVTRLAIVTEQQRQVFVSAAAAAGRQAAGPVAGHVIDIASGAPVAGAAVKLFVREQQGNHPQRFVEAGGTTTDKEGRYELRLDQGREYVAVASAALDGRPHEAATEASGFWQNLQPESHATIVLVTDRGIHRPGQIVFYKGIAAASNVATNSYRAIDKREIEVTLRDANGREVAKARHTTSPNGSFHGNFPIATGALPGQWSLFAQASGPDGCAGSVGVRVEEYKRPKFLVKLAAPEKSVPLGGELSLSGTATTYTGVAVAGAKVRWHVERTVRWPRWCQWFFPWLPFGGGGQRIARGTAITDAAGGFKVAFTAKPDKTVPKESLPVFNFRVVADVTDPSGETRGDERTVNAGYTDIEATVSAEAWQTTGDDGKPAAVAITLATATLDGQPRAATGTLTVSKLVQPAEVDRGDFFGTGPGPAPRPLRVRRGRGQAAGRPAAVPVRPTPADPLTWAVGEAVYSHEHATDKTTGKLVATATLPAGIYKAVFEIPAAGEVPAVRAEQLIEVIDPKADRYGVKRAFVMKSQRQSVAPGDAFTALVGTGYDKGRALVEISQAGRTLERFWTEPGRTQWPVSLKVGDEHRGGFTVRAWLVRDGRLHVQAQTIDVPWTNKQLAVEWERFTRRLEPGAKEIWRAKVRSVADPVAGPATPALAEMVATLYDQSLDAIAQHQWPGGGLMGLFRRESSWLNLAFSNGGEGFNQILGQFAIRYADVPEMSYRQLRNPFCSPMRGGWGGGFGGGGRRMAKGAMMREMAAAPMAMAAAPANAAADGLAMNAVRKRAADKDEPGAYRQAEKRQGDSAGPGGPAGASAAAAPPPRKNLVETAFFLPTLSSDKDGVVTIEFTLPDTLTTWQFKGLAHDAGLRSGVIVDQCVSVKDLMVEPVMPRFLREGDVVQIPVKVSNTSTGRLAGKVKLALFDARTDADYSALVEGPRELPFDLAAGESKPVVFTVKVADGTDTLRYLATGSAGRAADGEEAFLAVLPRRVLVSESVPVTLRGPGERKISIDRLVKSGGTAIQSQSLVVQTASNPAWYAVLALPAIMEQADESTETLFTRLYANSLARHLATSDPRIGKVFEQWKGAATAGKANALESPLDARRSNVDKNTDLVKTLLAETPWVRDAVDEKEARARIALLFDATRAENELAAGLGRLESLRNGDGGWPWFPGGRTCDSVTLGILAGFGRLRVAGVKPAVPGGNDLVQPALGTIPWLDGRLVGEKRRAEELWKGKPDEIVLTPLGVYALYARSFFSADAPPEGEAAEAIRWAFDVARKCWMKLDARLTQGQLAMALARSGDKQTALSIIDSLKQRAVDADVKPGAEKESWQGMWWRDRHPGWWSWTYAPIATQSIMIEAFDEVAGDRDAVEALKVWLLGQKRTSQWRGSRATADAVAALLGRGDDLLASKELVTVTVGGEKLAAGQVEAGTGFFEERFTRREIRPEMGQVVVAKRDPGLAFGGIHWQYLDDIANVPAAGREELSIEKRLFVKRMTKAGPELVPAAEGAAGKIELGDELVVRLVVTSDRDYEFLELKDHRPSLTEPVDVLSGWRFGDGVGWYVAVRDASTQLFFERLPRGTHVFEYALRAAHRGTASSGFATIQSRYAPEFSAHSASVPVEVR
jgi:hypothetical protein